MPQPRRLHLLEAAIVVGGALLAVVTAAVTHQNVSTFEDDQPLTAAVLQITQQVTLAKLWLEEAIDGEVPVNVERDVYGNLDRASSSCADLHAPAGGDQDPAKLSIGDPEVGASVAVLCEDIAAMRPLAEARLAQPETDAGSPEDRSYNSTYRTFLVRSDYVLGRVQESVEKDMAQVAAVSRWLSLTPLLASVLLAHIVSRHRRKTWRSSRELEKLAAIVNSSPNAILSTSTAGVVLAWNPGAEHLFGWGAEEIVGRDAGVLVPAGLRPMEEQTLARVRAGERVVAESARVCKDGSVVPVQVTVSPVYTDGKVTGIASIQRDITERLAKDAELIATREKALEASRLKSEFLATMSHELRTPMNGVLGLTHLLLQTPLDETQRDYAEGARTAGEALLGVIDDVLDFSKLEAGKIELEATPFQPRRLIEEVATVLAPSAQSKGLELTAFCLPEVPEVLVGDAGRLRQVLLNLGSNAVKFTSAGEVVIKVVSTRTESGAELVRFEVTDTGVGVEPENLDRIFESFAQADASTTRRFGGTGLGLAISRRLVEAMGGAIGVESEKGAGSTFWYQLPLRLGDPAAAAAALPNRAVLEGVRALVVDDNATSRSAIESLLASWGLDPRGAADAASALDLLREGAAATPYQMVVVDLHMPGMDGLELARQISSDPGLAGTGLVLLTSTTHVDGEELRAAGVREWLSKPVIGSQLHDRLVRLISAPQPRVGPPSLARASAAPQESLGHVLVVDDNEVNQMVAEATVSKLGYQVDVAGNGAEALEALATTRYSAILMDCHMPVMDGFQATEAIRRRYPGEHPPIIAMTAATMSGDRERCLAAGMDDFISKPVMPAELAAGLARWVGATAE